jgi:regulator of cell morphogenesis and NO signaling
MKPLTIIESPALPTVAEIVASDYRKANIFNQFGIDFCCGGKKNIAEVCTEKGIDLPTLEQALMQVSAQPAGSIHWNFQQWDTRFLTDFIVNAHHAYVRSQVPRLLAFGEKVVRSHAQKWPEVQKIHALVQALADELLAHMDQEEQVLFPYIKQLAESWQYAAEKPRAPFGSVQNPLRVMEMEHENAGQILLSIRALSNDHTAPAGACNTFRVWYALLREFEEDLHLHVHLENNILFPRAIALEKA